MEHLHGDGELLASGSVGHASKPRMVSSYASRLAGGLRRARSIRPIDRVLEDTDDAVGQLVLDREQVGQLAVVAFGPQVVPGRRIDQLPRHRTRLPALRTLPFEHVAGAERSADLLDIDRAARNVKLELRAITGNQRCIASRVRMSSASPSAKYS
jgi:hypothetical protein